jgi:hypothetical protein
MPSPHDLLQPSLQGQAAARAPYSQAASFACAVFGGPPAALMMAGINAWRLGRWPRDLRWLLPALLLWMGFEAWLWRSGGGAMTLRWLAGWFAAGGAGVLRTGIGLACFAGTVLLLHRREHRMADLMGLRRPDAWLVGLSVIVAGVALSYGLRRVLLAWPA